MPNADYEKEFGKGPHVTVDSLVVWCGMVLLIKRQDNTWALPGGFVEPGERLIDAAVRELIEETSLQLFTASNPCYTDDYRKEIIKDSFEYNFYNANPERDPRSHIITFVHVFHLPARFNTTIKAADDAKHAEWIHASDLFEQNQYGVITPKAHSYNFYADHAKLLHVGYKNRNFSVSLEEQFITRIND